MSAHLETGERIVWRHQPDARTLLHNRLPTVIIVTLMTAFIVGVGVSTLGTTIRGAPLEPGPPLIATAAIALFFLVLLYFFLSMLWNHARYLLDGWSTHYALTDRRFLVVSRRGLTAYDASFFHKMDALGGEPGKQVLMIDWGVGSRGREYFRDRIAGLPDAAKLERLIRDTLRA